MVLVGHWAPGLLPVTVVVGRQRGRTPGPGRLSAACSPAGAGGLGGPARVPPGSLIPAGVEGGRSLRVALLSVVSAGRKTSGPRD